MSNINLPITDANTTSGCGCGCGSTPPAAGEPASSASLTLQVDGITCGGCAAKVTKALNEDPAVNEVKVDLNPEGPATVSVTGGIAPESARSIIENAGYTVLR